MKWHSAVMIGAVLLLAGCQDEPASVKLELVAGKTFSVTRVDGKALPVVVGRLAGRALCENTPLLRSTLTFRVDNLLEQTVWTAADARASVFLAPYTQFEDGTIRVGEGEPGTISNGVVTIRAQTPFVCAPYTWEASLDQ